MMLYHHYSLRYSAHTIQTNRPLRFYMDEIKRWLDDHKSEIIVLWVTNHGGSCSGYPNIGGEGYENRVADLSNLLTGAFGGDSGLLMDRCELNKWPCVRDR